MTQSSLKKFTALAAFLYYPQFPTNFPDAHTTGYYYAPVAAGTAASEYNGYVVQGAWGRHPFFGTAMDITWQEIVNELPRREMNLLAAEAIGEQEKTLLVRPCDKLTRAVIALAKAELRQEADPKTQPLALENTVKSLDSLLEEARQEQELKDVMSVLVLTRAELQAVSGDVQRAVRGLAEQIPDLEPNENAHYLAMRFRALTRAAIEQDSDRLLQELDKTLRRPPGGAPAARPDIESLSDDLKFQMRDPRNDFVPMKPGKLDPNKRRARPFRMPMGVPVAFPAGPA